MYTCADNFTVVLRGRDKSAPIAALQQAKIYPARCGRHNPRDCRLVDCGSSWIAAARFEDILVDCGSAVVGVEAPQYKPIYTVPVLSNMGHQNSPLVKFLF